MAKRAAEAKKVEEEVSPKAQKKKEEKGGKDTSKTSTKKSSSKSSTSKSSSKQSSTKKEKNEKPKTEKSSKAKKDDKASKKQEEKPSVDPELLKKIEALEKTQKLLEKKEKALEAEKERVADLEKKISSFEESQKQFSDMESRMKELEASMISQVDEMSAPSFEPTILEEPSVSEPVAETIAVPEKLSVDVPTAIEEPTIPEIKEKATPLDSFEVDAPAVLHEEGAGVASATDDFPATPYDDPIGHLREVVSGLAAKVFEMEIKMDESLMGLRDVRSEIGGISQRVKDDIEEMQAVRPSAPATPKPTTELVGKVLEKEMRKIDEKIADLMDEVGFGESLDVSKIPPNILEIVYQSTLNDVFTAMKKHLGHYDAENVIGQIFEDVRLRTSGSELFYHDGRQISTRHIATAIEKKQVSAKQMHTTYSVLLDSMLETIPGYKAKNFRAVIKIKSQEYAIDSSTRHEYRLREIEDKIDNMARISSALSASLNAQHKELKGDLEALDQNLRAKVKDESNKTNSLFNAIPASYASVAMLEDMKTELDNMTRRIKSVTTDTGKIIANMDMASIPEKHPLSEKSEKTQTTGKHPLSDKSEKTQTTGKHPLSEKSEKTQTTGKHPLSDKSEKTQTTGKHPLSDKSEKYDEEVEEKKETSAGEVKKPKKGKEEEKPDAKDTKKAAKPKDDTKEKSKSETSEDEDSKKSLMPVGMGTMVLDDDDDEDSVDFLTQGHKKGKRKKEEDFDDDDGIVVSGSFMGMPSKKEPKKAKAEKPKVEPKKEEPKPKKDAKPKAEPKKEEPKKRKVEKPKVEPKKEEPKPKKDAKPKAEKPKAKPKKVEKPKKAEKKSESKPKKEDIGGSKASANVGGQGVRQQPKAKPKKSESKPKPKPKNGEKPKSSVPDGDKKKVLALLDKERSLVTLKKESPLKGKKLTDTLKVLLDEEKIEIEIRGRTAMYKKKK